jgi:hypothetical protein
MDYLVSRELNSLYMMLDIVFLLLFGFLLIAKKKHLTFLFGLAGGLIYFIVDYGIFYLWLGTREVVGADPMTFLLWLSISYGFTNFVWIWLFLDKDKKIIEWSLLILIGWFSIALISQGFGGSFRIIQISRGTTGYHGAMAIMLIFGYLFVIIKNLIYDTEPKIPILRLIFIGVVVQFSWESVLLISGIRPLGFKPIIINSLLETNLGLPYLFFIHKHLKKFEKEVPDFEIEPKNDTSVYELNH